MTDLTTIESHARARGAMHSEATTGFVGDLMLLVKARLTMLVVITTFVGFCLASPGDLDWGKLFHTVMGTALVAAAAAAFNQVLEVEVDRMMARTRQRPIAAGRMTRTTAALLGAAMSVIGLVQLAVATNFAATYLAAASLIIYVAMYTPMKRRTSICVTVGAVSGAIPPMIGWVAAENTHKVFDVGSLVLFGILFAWQMPHFLAIAWMYRDEYAHAGFVMLPKWDRSGLWTALQSLGYSVVLLGVTLVPYMTGHGGLVYLIGAVIFDLLLIICAVLFLVQRTRKSARLLFFASIAYLPALLCLMVFFRS